MFSKLRGTIAALVVVATSLTVVAVSQEVVHATAPTPIGGKLLDGGGPMFSPMCQVMTQGNASGKVRCWGETYQGGRGVGVTSDTGNDYLPNFVKAVGGTGDLTGAVRVSTGGSTSCALLNTAELACWAGNNSPSVGAGNLTGDANDIPRYVVKGAQTISAATTSGRLSAVVAVDVNHTVGCALTDDDADTSDGNALYCWGSGALTGGGATARPAPVLIKNDGVKQVAVGGSHACVILINGAMECWGSEYNGILGNGNTGYNNQNTPVAVTNMDGSAPGKQAIDVSIGSYSATCAALADNSMKCWGEAIRGHLGDGQGTTSAAVPTAVAGMTNVSKVSMGAYHSCALLTDGSVKCWGTGLGYTLGNSGGENQSNSTPISTDAGTSNLALAVSSYAASCVLRANDKVFCWGQNSSSYDYELGIGDYSLNTYTPVEVGAPTISSVYPSTGSVSGGGSIQLSGPLVKTATAVTIGGTAATNLSTSYWGLNVTVPAGTVGAADIVLTTPSGSTTKVGGYTYTLPVPTASYLNPSQVGGEGGSVTLSGSNFSSPTVTVNGRAATVTASTSSSVTFTAPAYVQGDPTSAPVVVTSYGQNITVGNNLTYQRPTVYNGSPFSGAVAGGTSVTFSGQYLSGVTAVSFGSTPATSFTVNNGSSITAVSPAGTAGSVTVTFTGVGGLSGTASWTYSSSNNGGSGGGSGGGGGGGYTPPPQCVTGAPTIGGTNPTLDTSFGTGGAIEFATTGMDNSLQGGVATSDGNIVVAESIEVSGNPVIKFRKYSPAGTLVSSFGTGGVLTVDKASGSSSEDAGEIAELSDGSLIATYTVRTFGGMNTSTQNYLLKITSNGAIDTSFGTNGYVTFAISSTANIRNLRALSDDSVVVLVSSYNQVMINELMKFTSSGAADSAFGTSGTLTLSSNEFDYSVSSSDSIFVGGSTSAMPSSATVKKYTSAGVLDTAWATSGVLTLSNVGNQGDGNSAQAVATDANNKIYVAVRAAPMQSNAATTKLLRLLADGTPDSSFGSGTLLSSASSPYVSGILVLADGNVILNSMNGGMTPSAGVSLVSSSGVLDSSHVTNTASLQFGTCALSETNVVQLTTGEVMVFGSTYPMGMMSGNSTGSLWKLNFSGVAGGTGSTGGGSNTPSALPAPTLVTSANAAALVRAPGSESIIVNGQEVVIESNNVNIPAARTPAAQRTAAQVASIQQAGAALLQQFLASLPAGATSTVTVVNTATGAVMQNLVFDANGNSVNVPVEDIVFLDGPQLSLMIGSNNANITADGKYQVGAGGIVGVTGSGLGASANGEIIAMSTPTLLANFQTTAVGDFSKSATLPASIGVGDHTLVVATGTTYAMMGIRVVPAALPTTGATTDRVVIIALFTLVFGALFFRGRRTFAL